MGFIIAYLCIIYIFIKHILSRKIKPKWPRISSMGMYFVNCKQGSKTKEDTSANTNIYNSP